MDKENNNQNKSQDNFDVLQNEAFAQDKILLRRVYVDICGDIPTALILSQILYWYLPDQEGKIKLRVKKDGEYCLVKKHSDWFNECRVNERTAQRSIKKLSRLGIIRTARRKFNNTPMVHIWLNQTKLNQLMKDQILLKEQKQEENNSDSDKLAELNQTNCQNQFGQIGRIFITDTTTDITSNNTFVNGALLKKNNAHDNKIINLTLIEKILNSKDVTLKYHTKETVKEILSYYLDQYENTFPWQHPILKIEYWQRVINDLFVNPVAAIAQDCDEDQLTAMIDNYFETEFPTKDVDYNILHFATMGIQDNRFFDAGLY